MGLAPKRHFVLKLLHVSLKILEIGIPMTLEAHKFFLQTSNLCEV
jgi:hypothetical protein